MPKVYFAKFNINEKIYDVYNNRESLNDLLNHIYTHMNTETELQDEMYGKTTNFKFIHLYKEPEKMIINGRLVAYAPGTHISYDEENDDIVETEDEKKATYVTFSFDLHREGIGFVPKNDFGRVQFTNRFEMLIEEMCDIGEVRVVLENDKEALDEQLKYFKHVKEVSFELIPPNNEKQLFNELFDLDPDKLEETGGTNFLMRFKGTAKKGLKLSADYMKSLILGVSIGYGVLKAEGKNTSDEDYVVNSKQSALYNRPIKDSKKNEIIEIEEKTRAGLTHLSYIKTSLRDKHSKDKEKKEELLKKMRLRDEQKEFEE